VIGSYGGSITIGTDTFISKGASDIFLLKINSNGQIAWAKTFGGSYDEHVCCGGNIAGFGTSFVVSGTFGQISASPSITTTALFDMTTLTSYGNGDAFIACYDGNGSLRWVKGAGSPLSDLGTMDNSTDGAGNIYINGGFSGGWMKFDTFQLNKIGGGLQMFTAKYDSSGNFIWARCAGGTSFGGSVYPASIAADSAGSVFLTGTFGDKPLNFGTLSLSPFSTGGDHDAYIAKYSTDGQFQWAKKAGWLSFDEGQGIAVDNSDNVYTAGYFTQIAWFDNADTLTTSDNSTYLACYSKGGSLKWASDCGPKRMFTSVALGKGQKIYLGGEFTAASVSFGNWMLSNNGASNGFVTVTGEATALPGIAADNTSVRYYPNPAQHILTIEDALGSLLLVSVYDVQGKLVKAISGTSGQRTMEIDIRDIPSGLLVIQVINRDGETKQFKVTKQ
jgi:hypothetical protein